EPIDNKKITETMKRIKKMLIASVAAILLLAFSITNLFRQNTDIAAKAVAAPAYPEEISFYDYEGKIKIREELDSEFLNSLREFSYRTSASVLSMSDRRENQLFSPVSLYMALTLAAGSGAG